MAKFTLVLLIICALVAAASAGTTHKKHHLQHVLSEERSSATTVFERKCVPCNGDMVSTDYEAGSSPGGDACATEVKKIRSLCHIQGGKHKVTEWLKCAQPKFCQIGITCGKNCMKAAWTDINDNGPKLGSDGKGHECTQCR
jgi:hypothetical protein